MSCFNLVQAYKGRGRKDESPDEKLKVVFRRSESWKGERLDLPCGNCVGCRLEYSRQWAVRCMHEASLHEFNSFVTLTYDDEHMPLGDGLCQRCAVPHEVAYSLCVADFQDFMKRLRKEYGQGVRFYHCGEYGERFGRPHYHALLFNIGFSDKKPFGSRNGNTLFVSDSLSRLWPFGFSSIGGVTFESASYVARYVMKKINFKPGDNLYGGRRPEYTTMSRRPGIGRGWIEKFYPEVYARDGVIVRGHVSKPPRFYDNFMAEKDRSTLELVKLEREKIGCNRFVNDVLSDGSVIRVSDSSTERLRVRELCKKAEISMLKRPLEGI